MKKDQKTYQQNLEIFNLIRQGKEEACVEFNSKIVKLFFSNQFAEQIVWRFSHGPWCTYDLNDEIKNDINKYFNQYIYNWEQTKNDENLSIQEIQSLKIVVMQNLIVWDFIMNDLEVCLDNNKNKSWLFCLEIGQNIESYKLNFY